MFFELLVIGGVAAKFVPGYFLREQLTGWRLSP